MTGAADCVCWAGRWNECVGDPVSTSHNYFGGTLLFHMQTGVRADRLRE